MNQQAELYCCPTVIEGEYPILFGYRSPENVLFLLGEQPLHSPDDLRNDVLINDILKLDESLSEIENLPRGYRAYRKNNMSSWKIAQADAQTGMGEYLDGHLEWMNKMYVDGYFTGGTVPHWYIFPGKPKLFGWISLVIALPLIAFWFYIYFDTSGSESKDVLPSLLFGILFLVIGFRLLLMKLKKNSIY